MIQRYNGIEKDDEGAYVLLDAHLAAMEDQKKAIIKIVEEMANCKNGASPVVVQEAIDKINAYGKDKRIDQTENKQ